LPSWIFVSLLPWLTAFDKSQWDFYFYLTVFIPGKNLSGFIQKIRIV
jgi:hypothetical protein